MLYGDTDMVQSRKEHKKQLAIVCIIFACGLAALTVGLTVRNKIVAIAGMLVFASFAYFWYDMKALPWRKYIRFLRDINTGRAHESSGIVVSVSGTPRQSEDGVTIRDVNLKIGQDAEESMFYWDESKPMPEILNKNVHITAYGRYITGLEII